MPGTCVSSLYHRASLSPKQPTQDRGDSSVFAAVWELVDLVYPCFPMARSYPPSGPGRTGGLGCTHCCVGVAGPCVSSFPRRASPSPKRPRQHRRDSAVSAAVWEWLALVYPRFSTGVPITQAAQVGAERLGCIRRCVGVVAPCAYFVLPRESLSPKQPKQGRWRYSSACAALWIWLDLVYPRSPTGRPYPATGLGRTGGTRVSPPLCGNGWTLCILVLPQGVPIPRAAHAGPGGLRCNHRYVGLPGPCVSSLSHGASLSRKRPRQDWRDSGVSAAKWDWLDLVFPRSPTGRPYPPSGPGGPGGTWLYPPLCGSVWALWILVLPRGVTIPQVTQAGPEELDCICRCVGMARPYGSSFSHPASLSPKRPRQD